MAPSPQTTSIPSRPSEINAPVRSHHLIWPYVLAALILLLLISLTIYYLYSRLRARRLGLPAPSLFSFGGRGRTTASQRSAATRSGGVFGWVKDKVSGLGGGSGAGYTGTGVRRGRGRGGFAAMDPDEAWDSRVGAEADYGYNAPYGEDTELGVTSPSAEPLAGHGERGRGYGPAGGLADIEPQDGRATSRARVDFEDRYEEEMHGGSGAGGVGSKGRVADPFGDAEASSLRGVSPRPVAGGLEESLTERKSMFREAV